MICISVQKEFIYDIDFGVSEYYFGEASDKDRFNIPEKRKSRL